MISIDLTLVFQIIGFFVLLFILNRFLFNPVLRILKEREERIEGTIKTAAETEKTIEQGIISYEKKLKEAAIKGNEERNKIRSQGLEREKEILDAARVKASAEISGIRKELEASKAAALTSLKAESKSISKDIAEKILERKTVTTLLAVFFAIIPALASASTGAEHGGDPGMTWKIINFVILTVGVYLVWTKAITKLLDKRSVEIKNALEEAKAAKAVADKKAAEYNEKLSTLERRLSEIHNELRLEGEAEKARIIKESEIAAVKLQEQAKVAAEQEIKKARIEIRKEVANLAVGMAEEILKKELSPADQERLVKGYLNNLRLN